jgi:hypothetical protein
MAWLGNTRALGGWQRRLVRPNRQGRRQLRIAMRKHFWTQPVVHPHVVVDGVQNTGDRFLFRQVRRTVPIGA